MTHHDVEHIFNEVRIERSRAINKWGEAFDSQNTINDWVTYIIIYAGKAAVMPFNLKNARDALIKTAGLCITAIDWLDRGVKPRHYDPK